MKTSPVNTFTRVFSSIIFLLVFSACSKESLSTCQKWEVKDEGFIKEGCIFSLSCGSHTLQLTFCGDGLKDAYAGNTVTISDVGCCTLTRTFVRVIQ